MIKDQTSRYFFGAHGVAIGGLLRKPFEEPIPAQAAVSLPESGGYGSSRVEHFRHRGIVSFKAAHSYAYGQKSSDGERFETLVTSVVEGLNILDVVTADRIVARLSLTHPDRDDSSPTISSAGSHYEGLRVAGRPVHYRWLDDPEESEREFHPTPLVNIVLDGDQNKGQENFIQVPHFGRIYLAEMLVWPRRRRVTMLRVELGCPTDGSADVSTVEGEAHRMP